MLLCMLHSYHCSGDCAIKCNSNDPCLIKKGKKPNRKPNPNILT